MLTSLTRRAFCALAIGTMNRPPASAVGEKNRKAVYYGTKSGLLFFDYPIFFGNGFDDLPCRGGCLDRTWGLEDPDAVNTTPLPELNAIGKEVKVEYRVQRDSFTSDIVALSDGIGNGGSVIFHVGDGTVNAAVDTLVRTLPPGVVRRAIVPAAFDLDRGTRSDYPRPAPPGTTYLSLSLRTPGASGPSGVCPGGDDRYNKVATCICGSGPVGVDLLEGFQF